MKTLIMYICASKDSFGAYSENYEGIFAAGNTIEDCKKDTFKSIELIKKTFPKNDWPEPIKGEFKIEWHYNI